MILEFLTRDPLADGVCPAKLFHKRFVYDHRTSLVGSIFVGEVAACCHFHAHGGDVLIIHDVEAERVVQSSIVGKSNIHPVAISEIM